MDTIGKIKILHYYGKFDTGKRSDSVIAGIRYYAVIYRFGHPISYSGRNSEQAVDRLYAAIRDLIRMEVVHILRTIVHTG